MANAAQLHTDHLTSELVAKTEAVVPGQNLQVGLLLEHDPHWHTYWKNSGDSGLQTRIEFTLPKGFEAEAIAWPVPKRIVLQELINYGYDHRTLLPVSIKVPATLNDQNVTIQAKAKWLICEEVCIPGEGSYSLTLPVSHQATIDSRWSSDFSWAEHHQPQMPSKLIDAQYQIHGDQLDLQLQGAGVPADIMQRQLFPEVRQLVAYSAPQVWQQTQQGWHLQLPLSEFFSKAPEQFAFLLVDPIHEQGIRIVASLDAAHSSMSPSKSTTAIPVIPPAVPLSSASPVKASSSMNVFLAMGLAFLGGLVLNLMPCVFPILSLKALAILKHADNRAELRRHGLFYTLGVVSSFVGIACLLLILRSGGEQFGWGFQLQEPRFIAILALLMCGIALNFMGLIEISGSFAGVGQHLISEGGVKGAFFTGVLACVVASPCTAPFMGTALGFAIAQPAGIALVIFAALGLGMAFPMGILGFVPGIARVLPKPGAWMDGFRQFMVFPLLFTMIWLVWVYGEQTSPLDMAYLLGVCTFMTFGVWVVHRAGQRSPSVSSKVWRLVGLLFIVASIIWPLLQKSVNRQAATVNAEISSTHAEVWSAERLAQYKAEGRPVLVNMTASWCITCLANQRAALSSSEFFALLAKKNVAYLKGDWTRPDPAISLYLQSFGRSGVPLYVVYPPNGASPHVLPQLLTPDIMQKALDF